MTIHEFVGFIYFKKNQRLNMFSSIFIIWLKHSFKKKIQMFRRNNGKEYFKKILGTYFLEKGMIHQSSCNDTPQ